MELVHIRLDSIVINLRYWNTASVFWDTEFPQRPLNKFTVLEILGKSWKISEDKSPDFSGPQSSVLFSFRDPPGFPADKRRG